MPASRSINGIIPDPQEWATFRQSFTDQTEFFKGKLPVPTAHWDDILKSEHDKGFMIAGATKAELLTDFQTAVSTAINEGKDLFWFKENFEAIVAKHGWTGWTGEGTQAGRDWRARIIYETNMRTSYAAGRWAQLNDPDLLKSRPYWKYVHSDSVANPRPLHQSWNGIVLPYTDAFWKTHFAPNGWGCRCRIIAVTPDQYKGAKAPNDGTYTHIDRNGVAHEVPNGIDYGWDYAPGASAWKPDVSRYAAPIAKALQADIAKIGQVASLRDAVIVPNTGDIARYADNVLSAIDDVHGVSVLPKIPFKTVDSIAQAGYEIDEKTAIAIELSTKARHNEFAIAHEIGHFIDHQGIGEVGVFASVSHPLLEGWRHAVDSSAATIALKNLPSLTQSDVDYLLSREEQWARSYSQYIALKSGNPILLNQLAIRLKYKLPEARNAQWQTDDFALIMMAFDKLFKELGWLR